MTTRITIGESLTTGKSGNGHRGGRRQRRGGMLRNLSAALAMLAALAAAAPSAALAQALPDDLTATAQLAQTQLEAARELSLQAPRQRFEPQSVVAEVGGSPEALYAWVVSETRFVPYQGALRGPSGVLMDRRGNSLDRALLLNELLALAGHDVRLVRTDLDDAAARSLLARQETLAAGQAAAAPTQSELEPLAAMLGTSPEYLEQTALAAAAESQALADEAARRTAEQSQALLGLLGAGFAGDPEALHAQQAAALTDHWWVQVSTAEGWLDLDPAAPGGQPGETVAAATQGLVLTDLAGLGAQWLQQVDFRVVVEIWEDGTLREEVPLQTVITPAESHGTVIGFRQTPGGWQEGFDPFAADSPVEALKDALLAPDRWTPAFTLGDQVISDRSFTLDGTIDAAQANSNAAAVGGMGMGGFFGGFGGAMAGEEPGAAEVTAQWLEFEVRVPGSESRTVRRKIFDLLGEDVRRGAIPETLELDDAQRLERALALFGETELLPLGGELANEFVDAILLEAQIDNLGLVLGALAGEERTGFEGLLEIAGELVSPSPLYGLALARSAWSDQNGAVFIGSPNLLAFHRRLTLSDETGIGGREGFDIVLNRVEVTGGVDPFLARLTQGVLDTNAEALLLAERRPGSQVVNAANAGLSAPLVLRGNPAELPPHLQAHASADLEAGYVVVVPDASADGATWWRIDPASGETLGMGTTGWGQAMTEYAEKVATVQQLRSQLQYYADMGRCLGLAVTGPLRGVEGPDNQLRECVWDLICGQVTSVLEIPFDKIQTNWTNMLIKKAINDTYTGICGMAKKELLL